MLWQSLWESLVLSFIQTVGPPDQAGAGIEFRDVKFQDAAGNTFFVEVLAGLQRGKAPPMGFEPVRVGPDLNLRLIRKESDKLQPVWVDGDGQMDFHTKVLFNRAAFPVFLGQQAPPT